MDDSITSQTLSSAAIVSHKWQYKQGSKGRVSFGEYGLSLSLSLGKKHDDDDDDGAEGERWEEGGGK